jgi:hypothetical protein
MRVVTIFSPSTITTSCVKTIKYYSSLMASPLQPPRTIVSTPEYAMAKIEETPMQDPRTGEFIPQSKEYLASVPGPDLYNAFVSLLRRHSRDGTIDKEDEDVPRHDYSLPNIVHLDAQRWGSALPCHRQLTNDSSTRRFISGVPYDPARHPMAPTKVE